MDARERILVKSQELFTKFGFRRVTMDEIALKTGMSKKTIYQSFLNKDEIVNEVVAALINKSVSSCDKLLPKAVNAIHEIFLDIDTIQEMLGEMNPVILNDLEKFFPAAYEKLHHYKHDYLFNKVKANLERGIEEELYRREINVDVVSKFRIETLLVPFNQDIYPYGKYNLAQVEIETLELYLYGISTIKGQELIKNYKQERLKIDNK